MARLVFRSDRDGIGGALTAFTHGEARLGNQVFRCRRSGSRRGLASSLGLATRQGMAGILFVPRLIRPGSGLDRVGVERAGVRDLLAGFQRDGVARAARGGDRVDSNVLETGGRRERARHVGSLFEGSVLGQVGGGRPRSRRRDGGIATGVLAGLFGHSTSQGRGGGVRRHSGHGCSTVLEDGFGFFVDLIGIEDVVDIVTTVVFLGGSGIGSPSAVHNKLKTSRDRQERVSEQTLQANADVTTYKGNARVGGTKEGKRRPMA